MQVILLERVENLGQMGDVVKVKSGYARNFLLPKVKALRATKDNIAYFEQQKASLEAVNAKKRTAAEKDAKKLDGQIVVIVRSAADSGQLYGSVTSRDIAEAAAKTGITIDRNQVVLNTNFKTVGLFPVRIKLHPEVDAEITINIARSADEAKLQKEKGGALITTETGETVVETEEAAEIAEEAKEEFIAEVVGETEEEAEVEAAAEEGAAEAEEAASGEEAEEEAKSA